MNNFSLSGLTSQIIEHWQIFSGIIIIFIIIGTAFKKWDEIRYACMRAWHVFPLMGTVAKASRQYSGNSSLVHDSNWLDVEMNIADLYYSEYASVNQNVTYYNQCKDYLSKVLESGRKKSPFWVLPLVIILMVMEAIGFAYVLGPFMAPHISANNLQVVVWSLALILSLISATIAHHAGKAQHYNSLLRRAKTWFRQSKSDQNLNEVSQIQIVHTYRDNEQPRYNQIAARLVIDDGCKEHTRPVIGFYAWIIIIAVSAFVVRDYTLQMVESEQAVNSIQSSSDVSSPWGNVLPAQAAQNDQQARQQAENDIQHSKHDASLVTFIILSVIYIGVQFFAFFLGRNLGFAGVHSEEAWLRTHRFPNAQAMRSWMERRKRAISMHADHKLSMLRRNLMNKTTTSAAERELLKDSVNRDFDSYIKKKEELLAQEREKSRLNELAEYQSYEQLEKNISQHAPATMNSGSPAIGQSSHVKAKDVHSTKEINQSPDKPSVMIQKEPTEMTPLDYPDITNVEEDELMLLVNIYPQFAQLNEQQIANIWSTQRLAKKCGMFGSEVSTGNK